MNSVETHIYCPNCHTLISRIGKAWHVTASTHIITDFSRTHHFNEQIKSHPKHEITQEIHHCSDACGLVTTIQQEACIIPEFKNK